MDVRNVTKFPKKEFPSFGTLKKKTYNAALNGWRADLNSLDPIFDGT
jgi:hypothetical protein